jgi:uncharacterized protein YjiS (DUF1127 family)
MKIVCMIKKKYDSYLERKRIMHELSLYTDRELHDIGIVRSDIPFFLMKKIKMKTLKSIINESMYVKRMIKNRSFGIISACRNEHSEDENQTATKNLHADLIKTGHNVIPAQGGFVENLGKPDQKDVTEDSFIVAHKKGSDDKGKVLNDLKTLGTKYKQESILHRPHNSEVASFHNTSDNPGEVNPVGKIHWGKEADKSPYFTKVNGKKFTFK